MRIAIYGAGAVGAFFGAKLARAGEDVHFIARGENLRALCAGGLTIVAADGGFALDRVQATGHLPDLGHVDLVVISVKCHQTAEILEPLAALCDRDTAILSLQNGVESEAVLSARLGPGHVLPGVAYISAELETPGRVRHAGGGEIVFGEIDGRLSDRARRVSDVFVRAGVPARVSQDIRRVLWQKLVWNATFNPLTALTGCVSTDLLETPETRVLAGEVMREVLAVARAEGVALGDEEVEKLLAATVRFGRVKTSMQVDRERGRPMEVEALSGVVVRRGAAHGVPTPIHRVLYAMLRAIDVKNRAVNVERLKGRTVEEVERLKG